VLTLRWDQQFESAFLQRGVIGEPFGSQVVRAFADRPEVSGRGVVCRRRSVSEEETRQRAVQPTIGGSVYVKPQEIVIA
jgi:hypothetical protein